MEVSAEGATLGSLLVAFVSITLGKIWGGYEKVSEGECDERRLSCREMCRLEVESLKCRVTKLERRLYKDD
jgi:hypothetical protein